MKSKFNKINLFILFIGLFFSTSYGLKAQKKLLQKAQTEQAKYRIAILYPNGEGKTFDMKYYQEKHMTMMADILGKNLKSLRIDKGIANGAVPDAPVPFLAIGYFYVDSIEEYNKAVIPQLDRIRADFKNYTNVLPMAQISEVVQ
jgi:uncharacterized protein (TIGR02118 family)